MDLIDLSLNMPYILLSTNTDTNLEKIEQTVLDIEFQEKLSLFLDQKQDTDQNQKILYLLMY